MDGKGYAFAYDDVQPDGGADQSGKVNDGHPRLFTVTVGGARSDSSNHGYAIPQQSPVPRPVQTQHQRPIPEQRGRDVLKNLAKGIFKRL